MSAKSEERTLRIPANIGSEQSELNLAIHCEFPTVFAASLIHRTIELLALINLSIVVIVVKYMKSETGFMDMNNGLVPTQ